MKSRKCPMCGRGQLVRGIKKLSFKYHGQMISYDQPGEHCNKCDDGIVTGVDIGVTEKYIHDRQCEIDGYLTSDEIRKIRKNLSLTQKQAAEIFGGGPNAFSKYERGEIRQTKALDHLLRLLNKYPKYLSELKQDRAA